MSVVKIDDHLFLGNMWSTCEDILMNNDIKCLISVGMDPMPSQYLNTIEHSSFKIDDNIHNSKLMSDEVLPNTMNIIDYAIKCDKNVLVHCAAGKSRSATVVINYIMQSKNMNFIDSYEYVKSKKSDIELNRGFFELLSSLPLKNKK